MEIEARTSYSKLLVFSGTDLGRYPRGELRNAHQRGYGLLALDARAMGAAYAAGLPFSTIDDWVEGKLMCQAKQDAAESEAQWFRAAGDRFTVNGICWPDFDREAMYWFWRTVSIGTELLMALRHHGVREVMCLDCQDPRPALFYDPTNVHFRLWRAWVDSEGRGSMRITKDRWHGEGSASKTAGLHKRVARRVLRWWHRAAPVIEQESSAGARRGLRLEDNRASVAGKILITINHGEAHRFVALIGELRNNFEGEVAIVILTGNAETASGLASRFLVPVFHVGNVANKDGCVESQLTQAYEFLLNKSEGELWHRSLAYLRFHFDYYCRERWPNLNSLFVYWLNEFREIEPSAVLVSTLEDSESQLPAEAANRLGIPTLAIPHGVGFTRKTLTRAKNVLWNFETDKKGYLRSGLGARQLMGCRGVMSKGEYPARTKQVVMWENDSRRRILALTAPIGHPGVLFPAINPRAQLRGLKLLGEVPVDMRSRVSVRIKPHPGYPDLEMIEAGGGRSAKDGILADMDLISVLRDCDLVVGLNYVGVGIVHAVQAEKPIIFLWLDPCIGRTDPFVFADIYAPAGEVIREAEGFWEFVRQLLSDNGVAERLQASSKEFLNGRLKEAHLPGLPEAFSRAMCHGRSVWEKTV